MSEYWEELVYIFGLVFCTCGGYAYVFFFHRTTQFSKS